MTSRLPGMELDGAGGAAAFHAGVLSSMGSRLAALGSSDPPVRAGELRDPEGNGIQLWQPMGPE
jgi:hypothetical protein